MMSIDRDSVQRLIKAADREAPKLSRRVREARLKLAAYEAKERAYREGPAGA